MGKIKKPTDEMDLATINQFKKELIEKYGDSIKEKVIDYSKGNNGRVEELLKKTLYYISESNEFQMVSFDTLPIYTFPIIVNSHLTFNIYNSELKVIGSLKIYERILKLIHDGDLSGGKSHEYNVFKKYIKLVSNKTCSKHVKSLKQS